MSKGFFPKLAAGNIRKNGKTYFPYILTCIMTVAIFYLVKSLSLNPGLEKMVGAQTLAYTMFLGSCVTALFAFIFLFYTNSFLIKRRKKEFGVFNILGMEKRHLAKTLAWESLYVALIGLGGGLIVGMALDKVMFLIITKVIGGEISLGFFVSGEAIGTTVILFAAIFLLIFLKTVRQIHVSNPVDLLREGHAGEKEPKSKWLMTLLGLACVGVGYYMALTVENPISSITAFFVAVVLVILGTYMLFTAGSIALLKLLRKNKKYYYKTKHFTSVSGMIYRMKQNAVGLANICILSTMVLVMISSTSSLMLGMEDITHTRYPNDFVVYSNEGSKERSEETFDKIRTLQTEKDLNVTGELQYTYLSFSSIEDGDTFQVSRGDSLMNIESITNLIFIPLSDYNAAMGTNKTLEDGEILLYSNRKSFNYPVLKVFDKEYSVKEKLDEFLGNGIMAANAANSQFIVVRDMEEINDLYEKQKEALTDIANECRYFYGFDTDASKEEQSDFYTAMMDLLAENEFQGSAESRFDARTSFLGLYGGFFFIGIFLGVLFIMATVLIIYYKQISEGYDDKERFEIMQKVGMSQQEVKASIRSQVLTVFFLPLIVAGIHVAVAFPLISKLLALLNLMNTGLYIACTGVCFLVFTAMYVLVYLLTAKTYYKIVSQ
mgnify:FL=1